MYDIGKWNSRDSGEHLCGDWTQCVSAIVQTGVTRKRYFRYLVLNLYWEPVTFISSSSKTTIRHKAGDNNMGDPVEYCPQRERVGERAVCLNIAAQIMEISPANHLRRTKCRPNRLHVLQIGRKTVANSTFFDKPIKPDVFKNIVKTRIIITDSTRAQNRFSRFVVVLPSGI